MKKTIAMILGLLMTFSLFACAGKEPPDPNLLSCGDYTLLYKSCEIVVDEDDENVLVITYDYTNNSKEENSYWWTLVTSATQGADELSAIDLRDENDHLMTASNEDKVAPGKTIEVHDTVVLKNLNDDVQVVMGLMWGDESEIDTVTIHLADAKTNP